MAQNLPFRQSSLVSWREVVGGKDCFQRPMLPSTHSEFFLSCILWWPASKMALHTPTSFSIKWQRPVYNNAYLMDGDF